MCICRMIHIRNIAIHEIAPTWQEKYICHLDTADKIRYVYSYLMY